VTEKTEYRWSTMLDNTIGQQSQTTLVVMVAFLVVFTLGAIGLGALLTHDYSEDALRLTVAGRQRQLSQQIAKTALQLAGSPEGSTRDGLRDELVTAYAQFEAALRALRSGGEASIGSEGTARLKPLFDEDSRQLLSQLEDAWKPVAAAATPIASLGGQEQAQRFARTVTAQNRTLLSLSEQLFAETQAESSHRLARLHYSQMMCFLLALLDSLLLLFIVLRQLTRARAGARQRQVMETVSAGICLVDGDGRIVAANSAAALLLGRSAESLEGEMLPALDGDGRLNHQTPTGRRVLAQVTRKSLPPPSILDLITLQDITDHIEHAEVLHSLAHHDPLTGLPNRRLFEDRIDVAIAQATRVRQRVGIALVDLDHFKPVNDTHGHSVGDLVLQTVAQRLAACARAGDTVARLGGDEFICVFTGIGGRDHLAALGQRLLDSLSAPLEYDSHFLPLPASIGLAIYPDDAEETADLIARADAAMYEAKQRGGNSVQGCCD
jgi:diguanylate cyclase (GGDEF)-like protein